MHRIAQALLCATFLTVGASIGVAQTAAHALGGEIIDCWIVDNPSASSGPNDALVFTAESGPRIRRIDTATGTSTFETIVNQISQSVVSQTLHGIYLTPSQSVGIAVGSGGRAYWAGINGPWFEFTQKPTALTVPDANLWKCYWRQNGGAHLGVVAGEHDTLVYTTTLQGTQWFKANGLSNVTAGSQRDFHALAFADDAVTPSGPHGIAAYRIFPLLATPQSTEEFGFYFTTDGINWTKSAPVPYPPGMSPSNPMLVWDIDFQPGSTQVAFAVGGLKLGNSEGFALVTTDGGVHWRPSVPACHATATAGRCPPPILGGLSPPTVCIGDKKPVGPEQLDHFATLYGVAALRDGSAIAVSYGGGIWRFDPAYAGTAGEWIELKDSSTFASGPIWGCDGLQVGNQDHLWLTGLFGELRTSSDLGLTYQQFSTGSGHTTNSPIPDRDWRLQDVAFGIDATATRAWAGGQQTLIVRSDDLGDTWTPVQYHVGAGDGRVNDIAASDSNHAMAITSMNKVLATTGGTCWAVSGPPAGAPFNDVVWHDASGLNTRFWIAGDAATLWVTDDMGINWSPVPLPSNVPSNFNCRSITFFNLDAIVVGDVNGQAEAYLLQQVLGPGAPVLTTTTVTDICAVVAPQLNAVADGGNNVFAVGEDGTILRYNGVTFSNAAPPGLPAEDLLQVCAVAAPGGGYHFFASGDRGTLLSKPPATNAWVALASLTTDELSGLAFLSPTIGLATGKNEFPELTSEPHTPTGWGDSTIIKIR